MEAMLLVWTERITFLNKLTSSMMHKAEHEVLSSVKFDVTTISFAKIGIFTQSENSLQLFQLISLHNYTTQINCLFSFS
jgi:hypothetical protein